jgi:hypothetical protein
MGQRRVAARLWMPTLAVLLLIAAPASRPGSSDLAPTQPGDRAEALGALPFGESLALGASRLSVSEFSRRIERSRALPFAAGLVALGGLLAVAVCWRCLLRKRRSRKVLSPLRRIAGPRAPPLQLA